MMGRAPGDAGNLKTTAYIAAEFARLGLKPAGDNGTWFQNLPFQFATPGHCLLQNSMQPARVPLRRSSQVLSCSTLRGAIYRSYW